MMDDRTRLILLNLIPDIGSLRLTRLLASFGSLEAVWAASATDLQQVEGIGPVLASRIVATRLELWRAEEEQRLAREHGGMIVTLHDADYPAVLRHIPDPPLVLYLKGAWRPEDATAVAIVGSRHASLYGLQMAERLAAELAVHGVTIVSGLARGIDAAAHRGALKAQGRTLAVLGGGLSRMYPPEHQELADRITASGAVISEYPMRMEPLAQNFPRRNRLISGLSLGVVIVEATRRSGALITADCALEQGREVFAVPGHADALSSQGTHWLLKQGARLVTSVEDILEELRLEPCETDVRRTLLETTTASSEQNELDGEEQRLLQHMRSDEPQELDALALTSGLPAAVCASALLRLELKARVQQLPGKRFVRRRV